jgi:hypothetical protein
MNLYGQEAALPKPDVPLRLMHAVLTVEGVFSSLQPRVGALWKLRDSAAHHGASADRRPTPNWLNEGRVANKA